MSREAPCPAEARVAAEAACGSDLLLKLISDRRGSAVWRVSGSERVAALKVGSGPEGAAITARETTVLERMRIHGTLLSRGRGHEMAWMLRPWYEGPSSWEAMRSARTGEGPLSLARTRAVELCEAVAQLHATGWVHSDLQPQHDIHTQDGVRFIDMAWAWNPDKLAASPLFMGGLPHLLAPELALSIHKGERPVAPSPSAEVYTLAASLWWAITEEWPLDYGRAGIDASKATAAALREVIGTREMPLRSPRIWPVVQDGLAHVLLAPPETRPSAAELADWLRAS
ncbi:hypothetical protein ACIBKX_07800 [Streptomyces sp. NPDC050658]|uniref:hypothetical protein n=1 Tax=unclassified Streptomyces TaxID=2593676 RepID=UPI0034385864